MNSRMDNAEEQISDLQDEIPNQSSRQKAKWKKNLKRNSIRDLWDNIKHANICIIEEIEKGIENVFEEIMAEKLPNLNKETDIQVQEAQRVPNKINSNRPTYYNKDIL